MKLNRIAMLLAVPCLAMTTTGTALAGYYGSDGGGSYDYAKVVRVEPQLRHVRVSTPRRECWEEQAPRYESRSGDRSATPMILGGILGGVIGNTIGEGNGKRAATVAGTLLGGSVGRDIGRRNDSYYADYSSREACRVVDDYAEEERIDGYRVTYRYNGEDYVTRTDHDPGDRIRVRVAVQPAE